MGYGDDAEVCSGHRHGEHVICRDRMSVSAVTPSPGPSEGKGPAVQRLFGAIARRYDLANHLLSLGLDFWWRSAGSRIVRAWQPRTRPRPRHRVAAISRARLRAPVRMAMVIGADFCLPMLLEARRKGRREARSRRTDCSFPSERGRSTPSRSPSVSATWNRGSARSRKSRACSARADICWCSIFPSRAPPLRPFYRLLPAPCPARTRAALTGRPEARTNTSAHQSKTFPERRSDERHDRRRRLRRRKMRTPHRRHRLALHRPGEMNSRTESCLRLRGWLVSPAGVSVGFGGSGVTGGASDGGWVPVRTESQAAGAEVPFAGAAAFGVSISAPFKASKSGLLSRKVPGLARRAWRTTIRPPCCRRC